MRKILRRRAVLSLSLIAPLIWVSVAAALIGGTPERPARVSLQLNAESAELADSPLVRGWLVSWDAEGAMIQESRSDEVGELYPWTTFRTKSVYDTIRRLNTRNDPRAWFELGLLMLELDGEDEAERAFTQALRLRPETEAAINHAKQLDQQGASPLGAADMYDSPAENAEDAEGTEGKPAPAVEEPPKPRSPQWPVIDERRALESTAKLKRKAAELLDKAGFRIRPIETECFILYSEMGDAESHRWAEQLDRMYVTLAETLDVPKKTRLFDGKCVIFIFNTRDRFLHFEKQAFGYDASGAGGLFHPRGGDAFVSFYRQSDDNRFLTVLLHESTHAFMYRYRSWSSLPTWANEGLADYIAGHLNTRSDEPRRHWSDAKRFVLNGGNVPEIFELNYRDNSWQDHDNGYAVSHMLVRYLIRHKPAEFKAWIDEIKDGTPWKEAFEKHFGVTTAKVAQGFAAEIRSEPHYSDRR